MIEYVQRDNFAVLKFFLEVVYDSIFFNVNMSLNSMGITETPMITKWRVFQLCVINYRLQRKSYLYRTIIKT